MSYRNGFRGKVVVCLLALCVIAGVGQQGLGQQIVVKLGVVALQRCYGKLLLGWRIKADSFASRSAYAMG